MSARISDSQVRQKIYPRTVIPAKAGIPLAIDIAVKKLCPGLRRGDEQWRTSDSGSPYEVVGVEMQAQSR
jgi:hypothetical protein